MKKYAWTLTELLMALVFIMVISGFLISNFKPSTQNSKIKIYATIRNLEKGIIAIDDKYEKIDIACAKGQGTCSDDSRKNIFYKGSETFCKELADVMNLKTFSCANTGADANLVFANGVEIFGLRSTIQKMGKTTAEGELYSYLDIGVDINGKAKGPNKIGVDRFPLRIFAMDNLVLPVNCSASTIYDWRQYDPPLGKTGIVSISDHPYCKTGKEFNGSKSTVDLQTNDELITYDTYVNKIRKLTDEEVATGTHAGQVEEKDTLVSYSRPFKTTACGVYNRTQDGLAQNRFFAASECPSNSIFPNCNKPDSEAICYFVLHRPVAGLSAVIQGMVGSDLDMD